MSADIISDLSEDGDTDADADDVNNDMGTIATCVDCGSTPATGTPIIWNTQMNLFRLPISTDPL